MKTPWVAVLLCALPLIAAAQNKYVGNEVCTTCHPAEASVFFKNPHFKSIASGKESPEKTGCEGCHGAGGNHVAAGGGKATIRAFSEFSATQTLNACLNCHSKDVPRANIRQSAHTAANVVCTSCHSIHSSTTPKFLLAKQQKDVCYTCHSSVRAQFDMPVKHRVNEGVVQCTDCHNPHGNSAPTIGTGTGMNLVSNSLDNEQPCMKCHVDKRGPFVFEHASVRVEGCTACHMPHGSMNAKLLKRPVVAMVCLECHNGAGSFGRQTNGVFPQTASHNMADPKFQQCTLCHVRIHGSNADQGFKR